MGACTHTNISIKCSEGILDLPNIIGCSENQAGGVRVARIPIWGIHDGVVGEGVHARGGGGGQGVDHPGVSRTSLLHLVCPQPRGQASKHKTGPLHHK